MATSQSVLLLQKQLNELLKHPVEGFSAGLVDNDNIYEWEIIIIGPPDTLYEGGFFKAKMTFPKACCFMDNEYPMMPPKLKFVSDMWHPNVYPDGEVPNDESPANIEAAKEWRENYPAFKKRVQRIVRNSIG
ncbi:11096_t:CDS:2 [Dentiscutata heterogama]|uniref:11096_t:CDS:1 n=1 Tax=Dentiscutata heterogama TaxID=1316150 RepID=A0ACA9MCD4_9GLOM|nr:11096_t:CDS:2 [Dentiscutata heterogama]